MTKADLITHFEERKIEHQAAYLRLKRAGWEGERLDRAKAASDREVAFCDEAISFLGDLPDAA